jgi:tetratricopeptide (TPR) repeat protein
VVKSWGTNAPIPQTILDLDVQNSLSQEQTQGASWALVSFLLNTDNEEYRRCLYEMFMVLSPEADRKTNAELAAKRLTPWVDMAQFTSDYTAYLSSRKTFTELVDEGRKAYLSKKYDKAELLFVSALNLKPVHFAPHYYLGLLAYEQKNYDLAENYYRSALQYGADPALVNYALGLNAMAASKKSDARTYLQKAVEAAPERYKTKVDELLKQLK